MCSHLHLPDSHALLCKHGQRRVPPPRLHHVYSQAAVIELFFWLQEWVSIQPYVSLRNMYKCFNILAEENTNVAYLTTCKKTQGTDVSKVWLLTEGRYVTS